MRNSNLQPGVTEDMIEHLDADNCVECGGDGCFRTPEVDAYGKFLQWMFLPCAFCNGTGVRDNSDDWLKGTDE